MSTHLKLELASLTIKTSLMLLLALGITPFMRRQSAAARHWVLSIAVLCAVSVPVVGVALPAWSLPTGEAVWRPVTSRYESSVGDSASPTIRFESLATLLETPDQTTRSRGFFGWSDLLLSAWAGGSALALFALGTGLLRLAWLSSRSEPVDAGPWFDVSSATASAFGLGSVRLLQSRHPSLLVAWGWWRPTVLLPASARTWQEERIRAVVAHELAHLMRHDWPIQIAAELLRVAWWFNPLVWIACSRLRRESEQACDDAVLGMGLDGPSYAKHLVDIARSLGRREWLPATAMARPSSLERRIVAMLNNDLSRRPLTRSGRFATLLLLSLVALPMATAQSFTTFSGTALDPTERAVQNVTVVLTNERTNSTYKVATDATGRFEFVGLVPGPYLLQAMALGFTVLQGSLTLTAEDVRQDLRLEVGSLQETVSVRGESGAADPVSIPLSRDRGDLARAASLASCKSSPAGGSINPPMKIYDQRPAYPASAQATGIEGVVSLQGLVGADGFMRDLRVIGTPPPDLAAAALDAVTQWQFTPTLLNCTPIDVGIHVTMQFDLGR